MNTRWLVNTPYPIGQTKIFYKSLDYHRGNPTTDKSVWDTGFSIKEEIDCFTDAHRSNWVHSGSQKTIFYGVRRSFGKLGIGRLPDRKELQVAKFKDDGNTNEYHGYPVDHTIMKDKVPTNILRDWFKQGIITKPQMSRMQRCME
ncbi:hypothetical protein QW71_24215 [Paenibacillus sp. IHB B 3415]|uniref:hypothetical protein n=1 Tax=Paenibacillus sp. IHB B 3415 TaxID=867080 RepID=UPI00057379A4|nr:hypothetical protein [Paenibacillus sp. IHB B 3415]KHL93246.1 hypothetical protein QW71_24215 [Paenibacillus sp. IHB B 3415]